jgi:signal transduction histidine kinase
VRSLTFGRKIGVGLASVVLGSLVITAVSLWALCTVIASRDEVTFEVLVTVVAFAALLVAGGVALLFRRLSRVLREKEREIDGYVAQIESSNRDLEAFAARAAHDLRSVLAPLSLLAQLLRRGASSPDKVVELAARIDQSIHRGTSVIDGLLAFSRAKEAADPDVSASVETAIRDVLAELAPEVERVGAQVEREVVEAKVACSPSLLYLVVLNLVGNALKFLHGRERRWVRVSASLADGACEIAVADSGPGIPIEAQARIFEPFFRVPGSQAKGTGLGLATVSRIVEAHRGRVALTSVPGEGATFRVWLPLAAAPKAVAGGIGAP